jgi:hypothetical protein
MCRDLDAVELARQLELDPQETVCQRKLDGTKVECRFFACCGYQRQRRVMKSVFRLAARRTICPRGLPAGLRAGE